MTRCSAGVLFNMFHLTRKRCSSWVLTLSDVTSTCGVGGDGGDSEAVLAQGTAGAGHSLENKQQQQNRLSLNIHHKNTFFPFIHNQLDWTRTQKFKKVNHKLENNSENL